MRTRWSRSRTSSTPATRSLHDPRPAEPHVRHALDREDIHALASSLDDVMDGTPPRPPSCVYRIQVVRPGASGSRIIVESADRLTEGMAALEKTATGCWRSPRSSASSNIRGRPRPPDPSSSCSTRRPTRSPIIKWKEIFDLLEAATDRCEDVANLLEGVVVVGTADAWTTYCWRCCCSSPSR